MRKNLLNAFVCGTLVFSSLAQAQQDRFAYAVTDLGKEGINWSYLRRIDLETGAFSDVLLAGNDLNRPRFDAETKKAFTAPIKDARYGNVVNAPFGTGVAALAFDRKHNRLYFTPMFIDQLRYIDLKTMNVYFITGSDFTGMTKKAADQSNIITRMTIGDDGNGYALTNDGSNLVMFTTGKNFSATSLGRLVDAPENGNVSVHNSCTSYGGDMIADNDGNLYIFSARNHVFKVNIETRVATHLGAVQGLPANFTINGAAVDNQNRILVTSATSSLPIHALDLGSMKATAINAENAWRCSDLANSNILQTRRPTEVPELLTSRASEVNDKIAIYPNPVTGDKFNIQFNLVEAGNYSVQVTDARGTLVSQKIVSVSGKGQTIGQVPVNAARAKGLYIVKVTAQDGQLIYSNKIVVQ